MFHWVFSLLNACVVGGAPHGFQGAGLCSTNRAGLPGIIDFPLYAFVKRTRTSQKISKISGSMVRIKYKVVLNKAGDRCCPRPTVESNLSGRFEGPRKKDPAAMNSPKHMRQRCRAMRFVPKTPPRTNMRTSPAAASSITDRKSTRLNSSHVRISYAVFCLKKKTQTR